MKIALKKKQTVPFIHPSGQVKLIFTIFLLFFFVSSVYFELWNIYFLIGS